MLLPEVVADGQLVGVGLDAGGEVGVRGGGCWGDHRSTPRNLLVNDFDHHHRDFALHCRRQQQWSDGEAGNSKSFLHTRLRHSTALQCHYTAPLH